MDAPVDQDQAGEDLGVPDQYMLTDQDTEMTAEEMGQQGPCPQYMRLVGDSCMDQWEAPNVPGQRPLVMYTFVEAEAWCQARGKRLCFDDEWMDACAGTDDLTYPYGDQRQPGVCNDDKVWRVYSQSKLSAWPADLASAEIETLEELFAAGRARGGQAAVSVDHVEELYQGSAAGEKPGCRLEGLEIFDTIGNVEEWTRRRDGGMPSFHGNLKGRYWAESRSCQSNVRTHGDGFRFYEIGFRCCMDRP